MEFSHIPVLKNETIDLLNVKKGGVYFDGTLGGAGHSKAIQEKAQNLASAKLEQRRIFAKKSNIF